DAEVSTAPAQRPEQILVLIARRAEHPAIGSHDLGREEIVGSKSSEPAEPPDTAAERQPGHTGGADETARHRQSMLLGRRVKLTPRGTSAAGDTAPRSVDHHGLHRRQIDHQTVLADRVAGVVMPPATY